MYKYYTGCGVLMYDPKLPFHQQLTQFLTSPGDMSELGRAQLKATGYSLSEVQSIEKAFEGVPQSAFIPENGRFIKLSADKYMHLGLMAVVSRLMQIHEATETEAKQAKELFVKIPS